MVNVERNSLSKAILIIIGVVPILAYEENGKPKARLLFSKQVLNKRIVQDMDLVLKYTLYNVGSGAAFKVHITDDGIDGKTFATHFGFVDVDIPAIPVGQNVSNTVVLRPKSVGHVNISSATVYYQRSFDPEDVQVGSSNEPGGFVIEPYASYQRRYCSHLVEWCYFAGLTSVLLVVSKRNGFHH